MYLRRRASMVVGGLHNTNQGQPEYYYRKYLVPERMFFARNTALIWLEIGRSTVQVVELQPSYRTSHHKGLSWAYSRLTLIGFSWSLSPSTTRARKSRSGLALMFTQ